MARDAETLSREEALSRINALIKDIRIAMLTTATADGSLHSRPMATQESEFKGELWFLTRIDSGKVSEIRDDAHVSLTYADQKHTFVSLAGKAFVSRDRSKINDLWNPMYKAWFPDGKEDPGIAVLRVQVETAEYWEAPSNAIVRNFKILRAALTGDHSHVGQNATARIA